MRTLLLVFCVLTFFGCTDNNIESCKDLIQFAKDNNGNMRKYAEFKSSAKKFTSCLPKSVVEENGKISNKNLKAFFKNPDNYTSNVETDTNFSTDSIKVKLHLENSASMWGYFKGQTECEATVGELLVDAGYLFGDDNVSFSYITDTIYPITPSSSFVSFMNRLEPNDLGIGNYKNTQLGDIFKTVIENTNKGEVSILISDCIYSINGKEKKDYQTLEWVLIKEAFLSALKKEDKNFSILINKFNSNFKGKYYATNPLTGMEAEKYLEDVKRPYYIFLMGNGDVIRSALKEIEINKYPGFENNYFISIRNASIDVLYSILTTDKIGRFTRGREDLKHSITRAAKAKRGLNEGEFGFAIGINNSSFILDEEYILNPKNYNLSSAYTLKVEKYEESGYTHKLLLTTSSLKEEELFIKFRQITPKWVADTNSDNDQNQAGAELSKTYGFRYFVEGIEKAFYTAYRNQYPDREDDNFYTIKINIEI